MKTLITKEEILSLDSRIKHIMIENPDGDIDEFYVKIRFDYKFENEDVKNNGRQEFSSFSKDVIIKEIRKFMRIEKESYRIM